MQVIDKVLILFIKAEDSQLVSREILLIPRNIMKQEQESRNKIQEPISF